MSGDDFGGVNLFGDFVFLHKGKMGRPRFERTEENANKISMLLAVGWSNERIAGCVIDPRTGKSISVPTLKRYFRAELQTRLVARDRLEARRLMVAYGAAEAGNVGAMRLFGQLLERNDMLMAERSVKQQMKSDVDNVPQGKKQIGQRAALDAQEALKRILEPSFPRAN